MTQKQYLRVGQSAKNRLFGVEPKRRTSHFQHQSRSTPLQMLVSQQGISNSRLAVILLGIFTLAIGIILSSIPWVDYLIYKNLKLINGTLSFYYWQKPGVNRFTKIWVFNMTNPDNFLNLGHKPKLEEIGPFVYREDMEKVNVRLFENGTTFYQHKKILNFVPELSVDRNSQLVVPNIPLLTLTSKGAELPAVLRLGLSLSLNTFYGMKPFNVLTADQLMFGYDETLTKLANTFYPRGKRPPAQMGLLLGRNSSALPDVASIFNGDSPGGWKEFGLMDKLNGLDHMPQWKQEPCNSIRASEGSLFPPRDKTGEDIVHLWDKDLCRSWVFQYRGDTEKHGVKVGRYTPHDNMLTSGDNYPPNKCFCPGRQPCPPDGFQSIRPCQFDAPIFTSFPHFLGVKDEKILNSVEGFNPDPKKHESLLLIQPKLGAPLEARVRVQINLEVKHANIGIVRKFPSIMFPMFWVEEGAEEIPDDIFTLIYLATTAADIFVPLTTYGLIVIGASILLGMFVHSYRHVVFTQENLERGKKKFRRGSSFLVNGQHRLLILRDSYTLLQNQTQETSLDPEPVAEDANE